MLLLQALPFRSPHLLLSLNLYFFLSLGIQPTIHHDSFWGHPPLFNHPLAAASPPVMSTAADLPDTGPGLRQRQSGIDHTAQQDIQAQCHGREPSDTKNSSEKHSKTYGRTPDGTGM